MNRRSFALALAAAGLATTVAARAAQPVTLVALVAANATDPFGELIAAFERAHRSVEVKASYGGTQILATQLEQGAPADLLLSADRSHIAKLEEERLVEPFRRVSAGHEVIVVPKANPAGITSLRDLGSKKLALVIGVDTVPIGEYTRKLLANAEADYGGGFARKALANAVSLETNVKQVLQKTALGEADAGIVYRTDVTPGFADQVRIVEIPAKYNVPAYNYIAVTRASAHAAQAHALVALALSPAGQAVFAKYHYDALR